jgi:hypothetical protein
MMTDYEYWQEIKRLSTERIDELAIKLALAQTPSKAWWINGLIETNKKWLALADYQIYCFEHHQNKIQEAKEFKVKTFRGNDDDV